MPTTSNTLSRLRFDRASIIAWAGRSLGGGTVCVEIADPTYEDLMTDSEIWLATYMSQIRSKIFTISPNKKVYQVEEDVDMVVDVAFPRSVNDADFIFDEDFDYPWPWRDGGRQIAGGRGGMSEIYQYQQAAETFSRVVSSDNVWHWDQEKRTLTISPARRAGKAIYWYSSRNLDYTRLSMEQGMLLRKYMLAQCKMTLGNIRSKFSELPTAGGKVTLNGPELIDQGQMEIDKLNDEILLLQTPMGPTTG